MTSPRRRSSQHLDIDVDRESLTRALRIVDALIKAFEKRGWAVRLGRGDDRKSYVSVLGQDIAFGIRETLKRVAVEPEPPRRLPSGEIYTPFTRDYEEVPSGRLALVIRNTWGFSVEKSRVETPRRPLEERINDFLIAIVKMAHERAERQERIRLDQERRLEEERIHALAARRRQAEEERRGKLGGQAAAWRRSLELVEYVASVRGCAQSTDLTNEERRRLEDWLVWAEGYARSLNPLAQPVMELIGSYGDRAESE